MRSPIVFRCHSGAMTRVLKFRGDRISFERVMWNSGFLERKPGKVKFLEFE